MRVKYLNKSFRDFLLLSVLAICVLLTTLAILSNIYRYSTVRTYELILLIIIGLIIIITMVFTIALLTVYYAYKKKYVSSGWLWLHKSGLKLILPLITLLAGIISYSKDEVRRFYVDVNNILVQSNNARYLPENVLVLLPHCLQDSVCQYKITNDIGNCRQCGKCCIGEIKEIAEDTGVKVAVATGGTLARSIVASTKPEIILSVACERDLTSGIADVGKLPVIGMINERPYGPCHNTTINVNGFRKKLYSILINQDGKE